MGIKSPGEKLAKDVTPIWILVFVVIKISVETTCNLTGFYSNVLKIAQIQVETTCKMMSFETKVLSLNFRLKRRVI